MKVRVTFKTPDALDRVLEDLSEEDQERVKEVSERWIKHGEVITIEIDTVKVTCRVLGVEE